MNKLLPFNKWSQERIAQGRKTCTTRTKKYWREEGADSPEEFEKVWRGIHRGHFITERDGKPVYVYVHFGWFGDNPEVRGIPALANPSSFK